MSTKLMEYSFEATAGVFYVSSSYVIFALEPLMPVMNAAGVPRKALKSVTVTLAEI